MRAQDLQDSGEIAGSTELSTIPSSSKHQALPLCSHKTERGMGMKELRERPQRMNHPGGQTTFIAAEEASTEKAQMSWHTTHGCLFPNPQTPTCATRPTENKMHRYGSLQTLIAIKDTLFRV